MNLVVWIVTGLLAALFLMSGTMKLAKSREQLAADPRMGWAETMPPALIKLIGASEVLGALGLVLPGALRIAVFLVPAAALGLALIMALAVVTHLRRGEAQTALFNLALLALALFVAVERLGAQSF